MRYALLVLLLSLCWAPSAFAEDDGFLLAGKIGGGLPFSDLKAHPTFALELGYVFAEARGSFAVLLDVSYAAPKAQGDQDDERIPEGKYKWRLQQTQVTLQPTFLYRMTSLSDVVVPYGGIGPRIYMLETVEDGSAGGEPFPTATEQSTEFGLGVPLGIEIGMGPGALIAEFLFQWGPLDHTITGDSNVGTVTMWLGYRAIL